MPLASDKRQSTRTQKKKERKKKKYQDPFTVNVAPGSEILFSSPAGKAAKKKTTTTTKTKQKQNKIKNRQTVRIWSTNGLQDLAKFKKKKRKSKNRKYGLVAP